MIKSFICIVALFGLGTCHMCFVNPYPRGPAVSEKSLNTVGTPECGLTSRPCGNYNGSIDDTANGVFAGKPFVVVLQKNFDYYYAADPGNFSVNIFKAKGIPIFFGSVPDTDYGSLSTYEVPGLIPADAEGRWGFQVMFAQYL